MVPQFIKDKGFTPAYKMLTVAIFFGALLPEYLMIIAPVVLLVIGISGKLSGEYKLKIDKTSAFIAIYAAYLLLTAIWSKHTMVSVSVGVVWLCAALCSLTVSSLCDTREKIENVMLCLVGTAAANSVIGIIQMCFMAVGKSELFPNPLYKRFDEIVYGLFNYNYFVEEVRDRVAACFENPLILATFLVMIFPIAAYCCFYTATKKRRAFSIISAVIIFFGLLFTFLRGAAVAVIVSFMVLSFAGKKPAKFMSGAAAASSLIMLIVIFERRGVSASQDISTNYRIGLWQCTFNSIKEHFLLGAGAGYNNITDYLFENGLEFAHSHNLFIEILAEGGIIGLAVFTALVCVIAYNFIKLCNMRGWHRSYAIAIMSSLSGFAVMSLFDNTLCTPKQIVFFALVAGCLEAIGKIPLKNKKTGDNK